jgi:hypothetical protein
VAELEPTAIEIAKPHFKRHAAEFLAALERKHDALKRRFDAIDALRFNRSFEHCVKVAKGIPERPQRTPAPKRRSTKPH